MAYPALFSASGVVYVNRSYTPPPSSDGSPLSPFRTVTEGYQAAQAGNTIRIFSGNYQEAAKLTISKTLLLQATNGTVNISAP